MHPREYRMPFTEEDVLAAMESAADGRLMREDVSEIMAGKFRMCKLLTKHLASGEWKEHLKYRQIEKTNNNGKVRRINAPEFITLVYEHLLKLKLEPLYERCDPKVSLNCKKGCGITPSATKAWKSRHVLPRLKHLYYDLRHLEWCVSADQRLCYEHVTPKVFRKALKRLVSAPWLIDYSVDVCFVGDKLPVGTPTSPLVHHIIMLGFHEWLCRNTEWRVCYADNCLAACRTREEARSLMWRIRQYWWYELGIRAKRSDTRIFAIDDKGFDFCGYRLYRFAGKGVCDHDKGLCLPRKGTLERARQCRSDRSWASYFGLLRHADCYGEMLKIERNMKLKDLTSKIRIDRKMDAKNIKAAELARSGRSFTVYDYEIRNSDKTGEPNWIKMLIGIPELTSDGELTGRMLAREVHGGMAGIVSWMSAAEKEYGKSALLPLEDVRIEDQCGYIFAESTNQIEYINLN